MMHYIHFTVLLSLAALCAGCAPAPPVAPGTLTLTDAEGRVVHLDQPAQRIVSLVPSNTEIVYALGAGDALVGVTALCDHPPQAARQTVLGDLVTIRAESVLAVRPDLVLGHRISPDGLLRSLRQHGVNVYSVHPRNLEGVLQSIRDIGLLCGKVEEASAVVEGLRGRIETVRAAVVDCATHTPRVYYGGLQPPMWAAASNTIADEMIRLAGGENVCADLGDNWLAVPREHLLATNPRVILHGVRPEYDTPAHRDAALERLRRDPVWKNLDAIRHGRFYLLDEDTTSRDGPRMVDALERMARHLHPECFPTP